MKKFAVFVSLFLASLLQHTAASPPLSGLDRTRRDVYCDTGVTYRHDGRCCSYCPAGTYVKSHCSRDGQRGQCEECDDGTFTEHANSLKRCLACTQCRPDQDLVKPCSHTDDGKCECQAGRFCHPDEACEVCKKCRSCKKDEEVVRNCTSTTNTECKKLQPKPASGSDDSAMIGVCVSIAVVASAIGLLIFFLYKRRRRTSESGTDEQMETKPESVYVFGDGGDGPSRRPSGSNPGLSRQLVRARASAGLEEERLIAGSLSSSASNSQHSLADPLAFAAPPVCPPQAWSTRREEEFLKLVPVKGEESLRACFCYFEELNVDFYKRFFRQLGVSDNDIKDREQHLYADRIHELLSVWVEKEGRHAGLADLLRVLLDLNQRFTAEVIKDLAVRNGHYEVRD